MGLLIPGDEVVVGDPGDEHVVLRVLKRSPEKGGTVRLLIEEAEVIPAGSFADGLLLEVKVGLDVAGDVSFGRYAAVRYGRSGTFFPA
ncbi:hypothetical protein [Nocardiopsis halophila]|uniref:hypothetical protein n=1 Tax=Nocardiopsis halophila TaxID=141692 RepID=UPI0003450170|nr:hypothetical protein [Nocardiopsis halophila]